MNRKLKTVGKVLLWTVIVIAVVVLALPLWIGPVVRGVSQKVVPGITGTGFHMGEFGLNVYNGHLHVGDLQLANPTNYSERNAVDLGKLDVNVAMTSLLAKKKRIESIDLDGLTVYSSPSAGNFRDIAAHASGADAEASEEPAVEEPAAEEPAVEERQGGGLQIDRITLKNITIKYGVVPVKIPMTIELTDIGKDEPEGATPTAVWEEVYGSVMKAAGAVAGAVGDLGKAAAGAVGDLGASAAGAVGDLGKAGLGAATGMLGSIADAATGVVSGGEDGGAEGVKASVVEGAEKAGEAAAAVLDAVKGTLSASGSEERKAAAPARKRVRSAVNTGGLFK